MPNLAKAGTMSNENLQTKSWQSNSYGDVNVLQLVASSLPVIKNPNEVLVQVRAASVNPIDLLVLGGYGRTLFKVKRHFRSEFPLTLGRDFAGTVLAKGNGVGDEINIGDDVYGFIPITKQGSFAETVLADKSHILPKPKHLTYAESASIVYATMTAWSALFLSGNLSPKQTEGVKVLILGASGGVGTLAIQLLKSQNCLVYGTCSTDAVSLVQSLGADKVFDYKDPDYNEQVAREGRYHIILDGAKIEYQNIPESWKHDYFITLNSPLLINTDRYGLIAGLVCSMYDLLKAKFTSSGTVKWGFFSASEEGFKFIDDLIRSQKIKPLIYKTFKFEELPAAMTAVSDGHCRGKVVIESTADNKTLT